MSNNFTAIVNLGADPEMLTLGSREVYKLRLADRGIGKNSVTFWFTALVSGPDNNTASRLVKGDKISITGHLNKTEFAPKKPRYKGEMMESFEMPFAKIMEVVRSDTFFNRDVGDFPPTDGTSNSTTSDVIDVVDTGSAGDPLEGL